MQSTRAQILQYLGDHPRSSAVQIARFLDLTPANIRYHLGILLESGQVQVSGKRSTGGAGRPILLYNLTSTYLGDNLAGLLVAILSWMESSQETDRIVEEISTRLLGEFKLTGNSIQRYNSGVYFLNQHRYHASWEAGSEGPQISLRHCPYRDLARIHPQLCRLDEKLISALLGSDMCLTQKRTFGNNPFSPCIFNPRITQDEKGNTYNRNS
jgi:predicted ArsR family transcriptional regulator